MKTLKTLHKLALLVLISALFVSCGNNNNDNPYQNALGTGAYSGSGNVIVNNSSDLQEQLKQRYATDLSFLQSGGRLACEYDCPERPLSGIIGNCVRIFKVVNGQIGFETYNKNAEIWQNHRDFDDIIGAKREEAHMTGTLSATSLDSYFTGLTQNIQLQRRQIQFPDMGLITIYDTPTPFGIMPFSPDIMFGAQELMLKQWCSAQR